MNELKNDAFANADRFKRIIKLDSVSSTNKYLKELKDAPCGTVVIASKQTSGRGRGDRRFYSPEGEGIYMSYLLCDQARESLHTVTPRCAVAVRRALQRECGTGDELKIKWVNDLLLNYKKVCGILSEAVFSDGKANVIVGIGVNVLQKKDSFPQEIAEKATSLLEQTGKRFDIQTLAMSIICELDAIFGNDEECFAEYESHCITLDKRCIVTSSGKDRAADVLGLEKDYSLKVRYDTGEEESLTSGEVRIRGFDGYI